MMLPTHMAPPMPAPPSSTGGSGKRRGCRVDGCHSCKPGKNHHCKSCGDKDSYHRSKDCPKLYPCKVKGCKSCKKGKTHFCKSCKDKDSMHSSSKCTPRHGRLMSNIQTLYHQTDEASFRLIEGSGLKMLRGSTGLAGGGIYFAVSKSDTAGKAHKKGVMLTCSVRLGKVKKVSSGGDASVTFSSLQKEGYDAVEIPRRGGTEFVVYNLDQVRIVSHKTM